MLDYNFKYWKLVVDHFHCQFHGTTTELKYSMAIGLVSCIYPTKYENELSTINTRHSRVWYYDSERDMLWSWFSLWCFLLERKTGETKLLLSQSKLYCSVSVLWPLVWKSELLTEYVEKNHEWSSRQYMVKMSENSDPARTSGFCVPFISTSIKVKTSKHKPNMCTFLDWNLSGIFGEIWPNLTGMKSF